MSTVCDTYCVLIHIFSHRLRDLETEGERKSITFYFCPFLFDLAKGTMV